MALAPTGTSVSVTYYIYAYMNSGVMALEYSTTGHSTDSGTGVEIKTGDPTRTLVGMARTGAGPAWVDTTAAKFVISWFNRRDLVAKDEATSGTISLTSLPGHVIATVYYLKWADEKEDLQYDGGFLGTGAASNVAAYAYKDGVLVGDSEQVSWFYGNTSAGVFSKIVNILNDTEGYHYATVNCVRSTTNATVNRIGIRANIKG